MDRETQLPSVDRDDAQDERDAEYFRAENEDDDGYDPYSDRIPDYEPCSRWSQILLG